jgi:Membrane domain of glycerophosphoryl diester phosphodiesterase
VALRRWRPLLGAFLLAAVVVGTLSFTAIGLILVVWLLVRWALIAQVVILEGKSPRAALRRSSQLVRGDWWRVASLVLFVTTIGLLLGPLLGAILLFATSASFNFVNLISSLVYVFALPFVAIATTYLYFDLELEKGEQPEREAVAVPAPT